MPAVTYKIKSCSSEDEVHPASNLTNNDLYRMWQTDGCHRKASVVLKLDKPTRIKSIELGNAGSAFVEILVGKDESEEYQVLLPMTSLMNFPDSKQGINRTKTKLLESEKLTAHVTKEKWSCIRVICTQPFTDSPIGLTYLYINPNTASENLSQPKSADLPLGISNAKSDTKPPLQDVDTEHNPSDTVVSVKKNSQEEPLVAPIALKRSDTEVDLVVEHIPKKEKHKSMSTDQILKGVYFTISGIQNPERAKIKARAESMGAEYRRDWEHDCTHLICTFSSTPKCTEAKKTGGVIVKPDWLYDCHQRKERLPAAAYGFTESKLSHTDDRSPKKKKSSISKVESKSSKKAKVHSTESAEEDDDGQPNEYDLADSFIDTSFDKGGEGGGDDDDYRDGSDEDINEVVSEGQRFLKRTGVYGKRKLGKTRADDATYKGGDHKRPKKEFDHKQSSKKGDKKQITYMSSSAESGTEEIADVDGRITYSPPSAKKKNNSRPPIQSGDIMAPAKTGYDSGDNSDGTQPIDDHELKEFMSDFHQGVNVNSGSGSDASQDTDTDTNWTSLVPHSSNKKDDDLSSKLGRDEPLKKLPDFLNGISVFFSGIAQQKGVEKNLRRYVIAYDGKIDEYLEDSTQFIITDKKWDSNFDAAQEGNPELRFLTPDWILACHKKSKLVDPKKYHIEKPN